MALWFHITGCTYGTWLPGDDRSFRTRHHREHILGNHKSPPPTGMYTARRHRAEESMREAGRAPVRLSPEAQRVALDTMIEAIRHHGGAVRIGCMDDHHFHLLVRLPDLPRDLNPWASKPTHFNAWVSCRNGDHLPLVRLIIGNAKRHTARELVRARLADPGGVWAARVHMRRIMDAAQCEEVVAYIRGHARDSDRVDGVGAAVMHEAESSRG